MFGRRNLLSKILKIFLYGIINFLLVLGLVSITKVNFQFSIHAIQSQFLQICIIVFVTGLVNYIIINNKF